MSIINWNNERMSVGNELIDTQHKKLVTLINNIIVSIQNNNQIEDIEKFIEDAISYTQYHFSAEENLFEELSLNKDDIKRHKKEHQDFIDKVNGLYQKIKNDKSIKNNYGIEMVTELFNFLREWIVHHIMVTDKNLLLKNNKVV